jgi:hypothetical protein
MALRGLGSELAPGKLLEAEAEVRTVVVDGAQRYRVELRTRRGEERGERSIDAVTCSGVAEATALVLSLALAAPPAAPESDDGAGATLEDAAPRAAGPEGDEPEAGTRETVRASGAPAAAFEVPASAAPATADRRMPPSAAPSSAATERAPARGAATPRRAVEPAASSHALALGVSLAGDIATLPSAAAGGGISLAWHGGRARLELEARRMAQSRTVDAFAAGARFSMTSIGARGCWAAHADETLELGPCGGADVHMVSAPGLGVEPDYSATAEWTALAAGVQGRVFLASWLALRARLEASIPLSRPIFVLEGGGRLHQPAALGGSAALGAELLFF